MNLKYTLNQRPKFNHLLMYGLQWLVISIPNVLTAALLGKIQFFDDPAMQTLYLQKLYFVIGTVMIAQALFGHKLPLIIGPAAVLIVGILSAQSAGFNVIYTSIAICGVVLFLLSISGLLGKIQKIFTPRIIITILCLIAMTLAPVFMNLLFKTGDMLFNFFYAIVAIIVAFVLNHVMRGIWKSATLVLVVIAGSIVYYLFNPIPEVAQVTGDYELSDFFIRPEFDFGVILSFLICFFALLINELGSIQSIYGMVNADKIEKRMSRGGAFTGLGNALAGMFGVIGPVDFSVSPGIVATSGCASRYPIVVCGIGLLICSVSTSLVSFLTMLPDVLIGVMLLYIVILQLGAAFNMMFETKAIQTFEHALTIAIPMGIGLFVSLIPSELANSLPALVRPILTNGFVMGVLFVVFFEHLVFFQRRK